MKRIKWAGICLFAMVVMQGGAWAREGASPIQFNNRLRVEWDDNIYQTDTNKTDSLKIIEELEILANFNLQNTFIGFRYRPSYIWWDKREPDKTDFNHEGDFVLNHSFTPRLSLSMVDTVRRGESPELEEAGEIVREKDNFWYNTVNGTLGYLLQPQTRVEASGRWITLQYDSSEVADTENFDIYVGGATFRHSFVKETTVMGELRGELVKYPTVDATDEDGNLIKDANGRVITLDRGSQSVYAGAGLEQVFNPSLLGSLRGGYQRKDFEAESIGAETSPYGDASLTLLPTPVLRITAGAGYSMFETAAWPFVNQDRSQVYLSAAYDVTAQLSLYGSAGLTRGQYSFDQSVEKEIDKITVKSGDEDSLLVSFRATYKVNRSNWIEGGWQYQNFDSGLERTDGSKLRVSYDRNRLDLGWKAHF